MAGGEFLASVLALQLAAGMHWSLLTSLSLWLFVERDGDGFISEYHCEDCQGSSMCEGL